MRNLNEYPVTLDEIVECLERYKTEALAQGNIGDMRPLLLDAAIGHVRTNSRTAVRQDGKVARIDDLDADQQLRPLGSR